MKRSVAQKSVLSVIVGIVSLAMLPHPALAQKLAIPRQHDRPPGPAITAQEAVQKMTVPPGFHVEIVATEPDIVNPVAMTIDAQGRFWVTESLEYPRTEPGVGKDRIKVLEDTDGDGRIDKSTLFAEGLNIPSGIAVGHGGVWVANAPDLLFFEDTDGDLKADKQTVLLTGFGRTDTHELPNAFTWGPDGYLYGLNGVFNYCDVHYTQENPNFSDDHPGWKFTCAMWRIDPRTKRFEIFAEGTSNPWGIAIDNQGEFFISACVIDHLWHITEDAYYIRQGGPYPPHTWPLRSIVDHHHQKAAYCGITYYDSDAYPQEYRNVLYMGNIHGGCLNSDVVAPKGSSYIGSPKPDLVTANDAWFMPVSQQTGPDGCLYILDWYDQYHCYQDANADPEGVERAKGRLYRLVYDGDDKSAGKTRLAKRNMTEHSDDELIRLLSSENGFERWTAQRLLQERSSVQTVDVLTAIVRDQSQSSRTQNHALWSLIGMNATAVPDELLKELATALGPNPASWCIRALGNRASYGDIQAESILTFGTGSNAFATDDASLCLDLISALKKCDKTSAAIRVELILALMLKHTDDLTVQHVAYNCVRAIGDSGSAADEIAEDLSLASTLGPYAAEWADGLLAWSDSASKISDKRVAAIAKAFLSAEENEIDVRRAVLAWIHENALRDSDEAEKLHQELKAANLTMIQKLAVNDSSLRDAATLVLAAWKDGDAAAKVQQLVINPQVSEDARLGALHTLIVSDAVYIEPALQVLSSSKETAEFKGRVIESLGRSNLDATALELLKLYDQFDQGLQSKVLELLSQRPNWTKHMLTTVENNAIPKDRFNLNQLRRMSNFKDEELSSRFERVFGQVRESSGDRQKVVNKMRDTLNSMRGDPFAGRAVFQRVCSQCHQLHGSGFQVGPDITRNGRNNWQQLLQNVFDPSAVIGPGFQAVTILTEDDRVLTGLPIEETEQAITLRMQGGKTELIPRDQIADLKRGEVSLMPEEIEKQMTTQETADLFAYLALDLPPEDPNAKLLPGSPAQNIRTKDNQ